MIQDSVHQDFNTGTVGCVDPRWSGHYFTGSTKHKRTTTEKLDKDGRILERTSIDEWDYPQQTWPNPYQPVWQDPTPYKVWCSDQTNTAYGEAMSPAF